MKELKDIAFSTTFDIKVEAVAATMLSQDEGLSLEQLVVAPKGSAKRRSNHEIKEIRRKDYDYDAVWLLEINRKGFLDTLPENLFLRLEDDYPDPIAKAKALNRQILEARKFFLPFEQATYLPRIETEQLEQRWTEFFPNFIEAIWGLPRFGDALSPRQRFLLCYLLPEAQRIVGDWTLTKLCFQAVLKKTVKIEVVAPLEYEIPSSGQQQGEMELGDLILGDTFKDDIPALEVSVEGITLDELPDYLPGGKKRWVLEDLLFSYFLPLDVSVVPRIIVTEDALGFEFGKAVLGYNAKLKESYFLYQEKAPELKKEVRCLKSFDEFRHLVRRAKSHEPDFGKNLLWEVNGKCVKEEDGGWASVKVSFVKQIIL